MLYIAMSETMQAGYRLLGAGILGLMLLSACGKNKNTWYPSGLFKNADGQYQTVTEETQANNTNNNNNPNLMNAPLGGPGMPFGPEVPPPLPLPLLDPLTSGPALPPPPPPFDDEGDPERPLIVVPRCGDRYLEQEVDSSGNYEAGEQCEDGNNISGDGCSDICLEEFCGNGYIEPEHGEQCDGGSTLTPLRNQPQAANCDKFCRLRICGDGIVQGAGIGTPAEQCDLGPLNGPCSGCTTSCLLRTACVNNVCTCPEED